MAYFGGGTRLERRKADLELKLCVKASGHPNIARLMYRGVELGGNAYNPLPFRWGYGWPYGRGYQVKSSKENQWIYRKLLEHFSMNAIE